MQKSILLRHQSTLLNAIKRNILDGYNDNVIRTDIWRKLLNDKRIG